MGPDPRDEFAEAIQYGRMTPTEAEAKLKALGLPPLAPNPDPVDFDPMGDVWWTLPMTLAWIAWRTSTEVARATDAFRVQVSYWEQKRWQVGVDGPVYEGFFLQPGGPANLLYLTVTEASHKTHGTLPKGAINIQSAKELLWKALGQNALQATGISTEGGPRTPVSDYEWRDLEIVQERNRDVVRHRERHGLSKRGYDDLAFRRQNVVAIWQPSRIEEHGLALPPTVRPAGPGYMPLYLAAQWIATQGGTFSFEPNYQPIWKQAYAELLDRIASGDVAATAMYEGKPVKLDGYMFAGIRVSYPFSDTPFELMVGNELYLSSYPSAGDEDWHNGFDDSLDNNNGRQWTRIMVAKPDVARWWPGSGTPAQSARSSGAPGRPTSMQLVRVEYEARWQRLEVKKGIGAEADALSAWLVGAYPEAPRLTPKTIANNLRDEHSKRWASARK